MKRSLALLLSACASALAGCSADHLSGTDEHRQADFINGDFETGSLAPWSVTPHLNKGIGIVPPTLLADLNLQAGGNDSLTKVVSGATPESVLAVGLGAGDTLLFPRFGNYSTVVNELGNNTNSNEMVQTLTTTAADIDPSDGNIHVRFVLAPVLQNPGHAANQQPYFYLELRNVTRNSLLFSSFNYSGQPGVPYKSSGGGSVQYTDWQLFDVAPGPTNLGVGDTIIMDVIASGCSLGGHWGHLYVDGFGAFIPGLTVTASAPQLVLAGTNMSYTFQVRNGAPAALSNVVVTEVLPTGTTFVSVSGATCATQPTLGGTGTLACQFGTLAAGASTSFQVTVNVNSTATGSINNGNYNIQGTGSSALIGPLVTTTILPSYLITTSVAGGNGTLTCASPVISGSNSVCTITPAPGYGLATLTVDGADVLSSVSGNTYTLTGVSAAHTVQASFGAVAKYSITASVPGGNGALSCQSPVAPGGSSVCTITPAASFALSGLTLDGVDVLAGVNGNTYTIGNVLASHTVQAVFSPAMYVITTSVLGGNGTLVCMNPLLAGANAVCTFMPSSGYRLGALYLDGTDVSAGVIGNTYTIPNVMAPHQLQAVFASSLYPITTSVPGGNGTLSCQSPVLYGGSSVCTITPAMGYALSALTRDGVDVMAGVTGNIYTLGNVTAAHAVQAAFSPAMYNISTAVPGGNGAVSCTSPLASGMNAVCTIAPAPGYGLATLTVDGNNVLAGVSGNTYTLANVTSSHLVQATFSQSMYLVSTSVPGGNGTLFCQSPVLNGASSVCSITPAVGFVLAALTLDGTSDLANVNGATYTIPAVTTSHAVTAAFAPATFAITASVPSGNGTVSCSSPVVYGGSAACTIAPATGYVLTGFSLDGTDVLAGVKNSTYVIANVTAAHLAQATFARAPYTITSSVPGGNGTITCATPVLYGQTAVCQISPATGYWLQALTVDGSDALRQVSGSSLAISGVVSDHAVVGFFALSTYQITVSVPGGNGIITCATPLSQGGTGVCTIMPATGYVLGSLTLDGADVMSQVDVGGLTIRNVTAPHLLQGTFVRTANTITVSVPGGNGTITCTGPVLYGQAAICQVLPAAGYRLAGLTLDGADVRQLLVGNNLVLSAVLAPHSVQGQFAKIPSYDITVNLPGPGGTVTCSTPVMEGQNALCTIAPAAGYALDALTLDGQDGRLLVTGYGFTLYNVNSAHTVAATFKRASANSCQSAADCVSGFCVDGVCCDRACTGQCEACDAIGSVGTCVPITGAPHTSHPTCGGFMCGEDGCLSECQSDADCLSGAVCVAGSCRQGQLALSGGGVSGCSAAGGHSSSGALAVFFVSWILLGLLRRRAAFAAKSWAR